MKKIFGVCILILLFLSLLVIFVSAVNESSMNSPKNLPKIVGLTQWIPEEYVHSVYMTEEEFYQGRERSYADYWGFVHEPRKGEELNDYFKSLNLIDDFVYVMIQFEDLGGDPSIEEMTILSENNVSLFEYHGDHTYYAKIPRSFLENKSYDFIRWIGIVEDSSMKLQPDLKEKVWGKNCRGILKLAISFYENLNNEQFREIKNLSGGCLIFGIDTLDCDAESNSDSIIMALRNFSTTKLEKIVEFNFVSKVGHGQMIAEVLGGAIGLIDPQKVDPYKNITCIE